MSGLFGILYYPIYMIMNFAIAWWNANAVGKIWTESKEIGGFMRVTAVAGYIMSIAGFTMVYSMIVIFAAPYILPMFSDQFTQVELQSQVLSLAGDMFYVLTAVTVIPTGYIIWFNSVKVFWQRKTMRNGLVAGWNTFATISNTINAVRHLPGALGRIKNALSDNAKGNNAILLFALLLVLIAVLGGYFTASAIMKRADAKYDYFSAMRSKYEANPQKYEKLAHG